MVILNNLYDKNSKFIKLSQTMILNDEISQQIIERNL